MNKKILSLVLTVVLAFGFSVAASAETSRDAGRMTLEQRINGLELAPQSKKSLLPKDYYNLDRVFKITNDTMSNAEKLKAIFLDVSQQLKNKGITNCYLHQWALKEALESIGFRVHELSGMTRTTGGKAGAVGLPDGWTYHYWIGLELDGDSNALPVSNPPSDRSPNVLAANTGVEVNGEVFYLDTNLYGTYGMPFKQCFLISPHDATWYQYAIINQLVG